MKIIISLLSIIIVLDIYRISIIIFRKDSSIQRKIFEILILFITIVMCLIIMKENNNFNLIYFFISLILSLYVVICFVLEFKNRKNFISILSIKSAIDKSQNGILFLNNKNNILLINKVMKSILEYYDINDNIITNLESKVFQKTNNDKLLKCLNKVWLLKIYNNKEIVVIDVTDLYTLNEKLEQQNKEQREYNNKILKALDNIEEINKSKNLIKLKNEFHDLLGHRLSLFKAYLNTSQINLKDIKFMINNLFYEDNSEESPSNKLSKLVNIYSVLGISININGKISNNNLGSIYFEIIREAVTNAIMHGSSKNIDINIYDNEMIISNDGEKPKKEIHENEGIKGMRRKLNDIGGTLFVDTIDKFTLRISAKK